MASMPYVIEQSSSGERSVDIFSRLLSDRIIVLSDEVTDQTASLVVAQLLFLESQDSTKDISLYINSPGGSVTAGLAIYDTMNYISFCKDFIASENMDMVCKADKAIMMNKAIELLKSSSNLDFSSFVNLAFGEKIKEQVAAFKEGYELSQAKLTDTIFPSMAALKKKSTTKITTIKLDKNFVIKVRGVKELLEQGYDEKRGMKYYKIYFEEEQ